MSLFARRIMGIETEYGIISPPLRPDAVARTMFQPVVDKYSSSNIFVPNGSRLYLDVGNHPEIATAECDSLSQLLAYERAGDRMMDRLARQAEEALDAKVYLFKNNVDSAGNSYGCHENYLVGRDIVVRELGRELLPFLITRQLLCGAGRVTPGGYLFSQRADHMWEGVSSATTRSRPIINTRDEPHGDSSRFRRMHVIVGDSNMAEPTFALKVGSMLLMLEMLEAGFDLPNLGVVEPVERMRDIARDLTGRTQLEFEEGGTVTALEIQETLCERAAAWLEERPDEGTPTAELARVVELWQRTLRAIRSGDVGLIDRDIDWAIKLRLVESFRQRLGCGWDHPKLAQVDLTYHDIRPGRGLYDALARRGQVNRWINDELIDAAVNNPPSTTRARLRGRFLAAALELGAEVTVDWTRLKVNRRYEEFADPFVSDDERLDELLGYMHSVTPD